MNDTRVLDACPTVRDLIEVLRHVDGSAAWHGWDDGSLVVETPDGELIVPNAADE